MVTLARSHKQLVECYRKLRGKPRSQTRRLIFYFITGFSLNKRREVMEENETNSTGILNAGDHIFVPRCGSYSHHGIVTANGEVIHFQTPMEIPQPDPADCRVVKTELALFLGSDKEFYIYRYGVSEQEILQNKMPKGTYSTKCSDPSEVVLERAHRLLREGFGHFNIVGNNCEDLAIFCKTGARSTESTLFSAALGSIEAARQANHLGYKSPLAFAGAAMGLFTAMDLRLSNQLAEKAREADVMIYEEESIRLADIAALQECEKELESTHDGDINGNTASKKPICVDELIEMLKNGKLENFTSKEKDNDDGTRYQETDV
ncbi:predicted protein [Nematostella vectensis]|uniref:LRAT domain-containing protein n=1 Tax=Nematostella vectensis TaxID=45351 RepID=A7SFY5_NEMVE|nr:predicted protein [Nematostella vectensis]|eukprot:XP_001629406.1 predicted protein [Nematostella vectensis]